MDFCLLARLEQETRLRQQVDWLRRFPLKEMLALGWLPAFDDEVQQLFELLKFFGVASPEQWAVVWGQPAAAFRQTAAFANQLEDVSAWLRRGEIEAQALACQPFAADAFRQALADSRALTVEPPEVFQPELVRRCAEAGVAVVFVPELPKTRVSGATRWLTPHKALIQLSLRYKTDDHLWFTFFHEAGHILLHGKREFFLEDELKNDKEREANEFAARTLIPPAAMSRFLGQVTSGQISKQAIRDFAAELGLAPGIVVGRLQHEGHLAYTHCNELKQTFTWAVASPLVGG